MYRGGYHHGEEGLSEPTRLAGVAAVSTAEAKAHCRVEPSATGDDALIDSYVDSAVSRVEAVCDRTVLLSSWTMTLDCFPGSWDGVPLGLYHGSGPIPNHLIRGGAFADRECIRLRRGKAVSVDAVRYLSTAGVVTTLDPSLYLAELSGLSGRLFPAYGKTWPATRSQAGAVQIDFKAGYALASQVPSRIKTAIKLTAAWLYENRGEADSVVPTAVEYLLDGFASGRMAV